MTHILVQHTIHTNLNTNIPFHFLGGKSHISATLLAWTPRGLHRLALGNLDLAFQSFQLTTKQVRNLVPPAPRDFTQWNRRWQLPDSNEIWCSRCRKLWSGLTHLRSRFILWRLLSHGFYCNQGGTLWGVDPGCPICEDEPETIEHLLFHCPQVWHRWNRLRIATRNTSMDFYNCLTLGDIVLRAIFRQRRCPALFILVAETLSSTWTERNVVVFRDKWTMAPLVLIWRHMAVNLEVIWVRVTNPRISRVIS